LDQADDPARNVVHISENDLIPADVEAVLADHTSEGRSRSSGRPVAWGYTADGRYIIVIYDVIDEDTIRPVTAYEVEEP
jgi:uncharacterized DUF497 family protein